MSPEKPESYLQYFMFSDEKYYYVGKNNMQLLQR